MDDPATVLALLGLAAPAPASSTPSSAGRAIQLPALLLGMPTAAPVEILATNKVASICGTSERVHLLPAHPARPRTFPAADGAGLGSAASAAVASHVPVTCSSPSLVVLVVVGGYVPLKPDLGADRAALPGHRHPPPRWPPVS